MNEFKIIAIGYIIFSCFGLFYILQPHIRTFFRERKFKKQKQNNCQQK